MSEELEPAELSLPEGWQIHEDFKQEDLERFEREKDKIDEEIPLGDSPMTSVARNNRRWITAAIRANWLNAPCKVSDIGNQNPAILSLIARVVSQMYFLSVSPTEKKF